jgi:hypothetical protein
VASVGSSGLVTANAAGSATITVTTADGNRTATCVFTIILVSNPDFEVVNGVLIAYHGIGGNVVIPDNLGITAIGDRVFESNSSLTAITIPNGITSIGIYAFRNTNITSVTIPNSVTSIDLNSPFDYCLNLTEIIVNVWNPQYSSDNGVLYNKNKTTLITYPAGKQGTFTIPNSVTNTTHEAFRGSHGLTSVTIPSSVTSIGGQAFHECISLTSVTNSSPTPQSITDFVFGLVPLSSATLYVPSGAKALYEAATGWKNFGTIIESAATTSSKEDDGSITDREEMTNADISAYVNVSRLYVSSPESERIAIYSLGGSLIYQSGKPAGKASFDIGSLPKGMLIVRGSSGWVRKAVKQ